MKATPQNAPRPTNAKGIGASRLRPLNPLGAARSLGTCVQECGLPSCRLAGGLTEYGLSGTVAPFRSGSCQVAVADLNTYHKNPRRGDVDVIAESLRELGQYKPLVVNEGTKTGRPNEVLAGNHTLLAARQLGWDEVEVHFVDYDDIEAATLAGDVDAETLRAIDDAVNAQAIEGDGDGSDSGEGAEG